MHFIQLDYNDGMNQPITESFLYGDHQLEGMMLDADEEVIIKSEWNIVNNNYAPDWAITVHGDSNVEGSLILTHSEGL